MRERAATLALLPMMVAILAAPSAVQAQEQPYPNRPIILVVPNPPGGTVDIMARAVADSMGKELGQRVVVENRSPGASGTIAARQFVRVAPDGYTLLMGFTTLLATAPSLFSNVNFDPRKDFTPIGLIGSTPSVVVTNLDLPVHNTRELIALMKTSPKPVQVGSAGVVSTNYLTAAMFAREAGVKIEQIPYKGSGPVITDLIGGHIKVVFNPLPAARAAIENKQIRAIAVTSLTRSPLFPDVEPIAESGLPGFNSVLSYGIVGPAGLPRPIVERLNAALKVALGTELVRKRILEEGAESSPGTPEDYAAIIDRQETQWSGVIKAMGLKVKD